jgi:hypothetical protein
MRRSQRLIAVALVIALSGALAGCSGGGGFSSFDPTDWLDFLDNKKKLEGERKPVFPDGVPGLEQGVPKDLYKGASQQQIDADRARAAAAAAAPPADPKSKRAAKKDKSKDAAKQPDTAAAEDASTAEAPPAPKPKKIVHRRTTAPPPDQPAGTPAQPAAAGQPAPAAQPSQAAPPSQQSGAPFPAPMPSGTFTR